MASLFELLFDTMPFAGVTGALKVKYNDQKGIAERTVGDLGSYVTYVPPEKLSSLGVYAPPIDPAVGNLEQDGIKTIDQSAETVLGTNPEQRDATTKEDARRSRNIWSYNATASTATESINSISVLTSGDGYARYRVLDGVRFGCDFDGKFDNALEIVHHDDLMGTDFKYTLPLGDANCLATFQVKNGINPAGNHQLWPLKARHDCAVLRVFAYDVLLGLDGVTPLTALPAGHADDANVKKFLASCNGLSTSDTGLVRDKLFADDLWRALHTEQPVIVAGGALDVYRARVRAGSTRVVVCCALTLHKEDDTFTPFRPAWAARLCPHIMVLSTQKLAEVRAAVQFARPAKTAIDGFSATPNEVQHCSEMNSTIGPFLIADANSDNLIYGPHRVIGLPQGYWNNVFNYYLANAFDELPGKVAKVVDHTKTSGRSFEGAIARKDDEAGKVTRMPRQAAFDNLHLAPTMKVPEVVSAAWGAGTAVVDSREKWFLDNVYMAPVCAHDCFHTHWRWSDVYISDIAHYGWGSAGPHTKPGFPMVPPNQDVYIRLNAANVATYWARAFEVPEGVTAPSSSWQVFCHHGSAYVVEAKAATDQMKWAATSMPGTGDDGGVVQFRKADQTWVGLGRWSVWYWNNRYYVDETKVPADRVKITDINMILNESRSRGRG